MYERAIAFKVSIGDILNAVFHASSGGYDPNYADIAGKKVNRVNLIAKLAKEADDLVVEDGTGKIKVVLFGAPLLADVGDTVRVIGKIREMNGERFIAAEVVRRVEEKELELRKIELSK
ncbi:MAG: hypothetical protein J7L23_02465 [Candidatus Diapherotrites archaeon]|nr:hypothetical protein [Candidatus Diapherotrites archaeon]